MTKIDQLFHGIFIIFVLFQKVMKYLVISAVLCLHFIICELERTTINVDMSIQLF